MTLARVPDPDWLQLTELCLDMAASWPEMCRLAAIVPGPDGYGAGGSAGGARGAGVSNPTAKLVEATAGGKDLLSGDDRTTPDTWHVPGERVGELVEHLLRQSRAMHDNARRIASLKRLIENRGDERYGRQSSLQGDCLACDKPVTGVAEDRIKAGYCPTCYRAWLRFRLEQMRSGHTPDHEVFRKRRAAKAKAEAKAAQAQRQAS